MTRRLLIVDDDIAHLQMLSTVLSEEGYEVYQASDGLSAIEIVTKQPVDLILLDIRMEPMDGVETHGHIKTINPSIPVVVMTAYASVDTAVSLLKAGAFDYLTKPVDTEELKLLINKTFRFQTLEEENQRLKERLGVQFDMVGIIGRSPVMERLFERLAMVAPSEATVLIIGDSGTGKELTASAIHENSKRRKNPFIKVNCAALPEQLLESELFGHEKGAFTGAHARKKGHFMRANKGTLFLDEIGELPITTQVKLLRVLQEREFEPVGGTSTIKVDVRIIAATNRDLAEDITQGRFREDLYFRLNVVQVKVPTLKERREDISLLAEHFRKIYADKNNRNLSRFSPRAMDLLLQYEWPGNVRELSNVVEHAVILEKNDLITRNALPAYLYKQSAGGDPNGSNEEDMTLKAMEKEMILRTLSSTDGNRTKTAKILGISRRTLQNKLKEYGVN